jgi:hypothetical protein
MELLNPLTVAQATWLYPAKSLLVTGSPGLSVGDCVYISGPKVGDRCQVGRADPRDFLKMPAIGILIAMAISGQGEVQILGELPGVYSGLNVRKSLFVDETGRLSEAPPAPLLGAYAYVQALGYSIDPSSLILVPSFTMVKRIG